MRSVHDESVPAVPAWVSPPPLPERERRLQIWEIIVVFAVSLGASSVRSLVFLIGGCGLGLYILAFKAGISLDIVAASLPDVWWRIPVLLLSALQDGILEEVLVVGYLLSRLRLLGVSPAWAVAIGAVLRGSYHLHQGIGPFIGNVIMGVLFGVLFLRWRRVNPMIIAHMLINSVAFIGYTLLAGHVSWLP